MINGWHMFLMPLEIMRKRDESCIGSILSVSARRPFFRAFSLILRAIIHICHNNSPSRYYCRIMIILIILITIIIAISSSSLLLLLLIINY